MNRQRSHPAPSRGSPPSDPAGPARQAAWAVGDALVVVARHLTTVWVDTAGEPVALQAVRRVSRLAAAHYRLAGLDDRAADVDAARRHLEKLARQRPAGGRP